MKPTRIAVVGIGHLGSIHTKLWRDAAAQSPEVVQLRALYDHHPERALRAAQELALTETLGYTVQVCNSLEEIFDNADAVTIVSPTSTHHAIARECLLRGKHCFIEKPITTTFREAAHLAEIAAEQGVIVHVGHVERYNTAFQALSARIHTPPHFIEARRFAPFKPRAADVSVVADLMIHDLDLALRLASAPVTSVQAHGAGMITTTNDVANARIEFANGCVASLTVSRVSSFAERTMLVVSADRAYTLNFASDELEICTTTAGGSQLHYEKPVIPQQNAIQQEQYAFVRAVQGLGEGENISATAYEVLDVMRVMEEIEKCIRVGMQ
jgi:predicted dehydrogenase